MSVDILSLPYPVRKELGDLVNMCARFDPDSDDIHEFAASEDVCAQVGRIVRALLKNGDAR